MQNFDCHSIHNYPEANFDQINSLVSDVRENLDVLITTKNLNFLHLLELPQNLLTPLENLDALSTNLFQETKSKINEEQQKYLVQCQRTLAVFYCYIQHFFVIYSEKESIEPTADVSDKEARKIAYEFCHNATYELRTPFYNLKLYTQAKKYDPGTKIWEEFVEHIYSSPFIPENQKKIDEISYWVDILGEFYDGLFLLVHKFFSGGGG